MAALIIEDPAQTWLVELRPGETLVIGRGAENDLPVTAERASRRHAEVRPAGAGHVVADLGSTNGTRVNDAPLEVPHTLRDGDVIDVGGTRLRYASGTDA